MIKYLLFLILPLAARAVDYPASTFGIRSDGVTLNTRSIQFAVDYIHDHGGGRLVFEVGRYLTGSIHLKSDVGLELKEGSVLLGSLNPFDYDKDGFTALLLADSQRNISITGRGMIDGRGREVATAIVALVHGGIIRDPLTSDRPNEANRPMLIYFKHCHSVCLRSITLANAASWVETYDQCSGLRIDSIRVDSKAYWNNDGIDIVDCSQVRVAGCQIDAADDGICLKSHDPAAACANILIRDCTIRSSASAIKFGTVSRGGFRHINILHNRVYDTYRSALALEAVDGAAIEDVLADSLDAVNTGNALFMRIGARSGAKQSRLTNVTIRHLSVRIAAGKADSGYPYEGPVQDLPRNISPIVLTGLPGAFLQDIRLEDVSVTYPGGGNPDVASRTPSDSIPELAASYPEFSMFKELPAWGLYIRHARGVQVKNLRLACAAKDYRPAIVLDDVQGANWEGTMVKEPGKRPAFPSRIGTRYPE
ncbi:MAG TPA: glycosyl hydrolase family 28 protein [Puia sp.]|nr:glycosyl hydrolase family 28 protein [Puia sp.]